MCPSRKGGFSLADADTAAIRIVEVSAPRTKRAPWDFRLNRDNDAIPSWNFRIKAKRIYRVNLAAS